MSEAVLNIRAVEMSALRRKNRELRRQLSELEGILHDNDSAVTMLHRLALLLIARPAGWRGKCEELLRRGTNSAGCKIIVFGKSHAGLLGKAAKLPAGGRVDDLPFVKVVESSVYYHLPVRAGSKTKGVVIFSMKRAAFREGDDDFCRRIAALLSAAL